MSVAYFCLVEIAFQIHFYLFSSAILAMEADSRNDLSFSNTALHSIGTTNTPQKCTFNFWSPGLILPEASKQLNFSLLALS